MTTPNSTPPDLTQDELTMLDCLANGMTRGQIAKYMRKSDQDVKDGLKLLFPKLHASRATQAVTNAYEAGLLPRSADDLLRVYHAIRDRLRRELPSFESGKDASR